MKILIVTGSRADYGLLEWPIKTLQEDLYFQGQILNVWGQKFDQAFCTAANALESERPDLILVLGDRFEILAVSTAAHLLRVPDELLAVVDEVQELGMGEEVVGDMWTRKGINLAVDPFASTVRIGAHQYYVLGWNA